jgi:hypothetical protein
MEFLIILACMLGYVVLAVIFVFVVRKITTLKLFRWLAVAFVILLPTWDVVLGYLVYFPACMFIPKVAIYETAETEGIYYEGQREYIMRLERNRPEQTDKELIKIGAVFDYVAFGLGYRFVESQVVEVHDYELRQQTLKTRINPSVYRCTPLLKDDRSECTKVDAPQSRYMVKVKTINIITTEINFKKIIDRTTGKLIAEYNRVYFSGFSPPIPFFNWLYKLDGSGIGNLECPHFSNNYEDFEYKVLKPKK